MASMHDEEKAVPRTINQTPSSSSSLNDTNKIGTANNVVEYNSNPVTQNHGILSRLRKLEDALDRKLGVESQAIDRVKPEDKAHQPWHEQAVMALMWASGTLQISCFATGFIGSELGLSLGQSITITIFATLVGAMVTGYMSTMGAATGLRQVSISRYSFGWYPSKLIALLNTISNIGWASVGCITGGLALSAVSGGRVGLAPGIVIIATGSLVVTFIGLRAVLKLDKYAWFVFLVLFLVMYGEAAPYATPSAPSDVSGSVLSAEALTLFAIVYGSTASWASIASDYYVHYPVNTNRYKIFTLTTLGLFLPTSLGMVLGCTVGSAMMTTRPDWAELNEDKGVGYVMLAMLHPAGWAKFTVIILMLSGIACNCINMYSSALSIQQFTRYAAIIPRFIWSFVVYGIVIALALAGRDRLLTVLENLLALLGYWSTSFFVVVAVEHIWFRGNDFSKYDLNVWNDPAGLPVGIAGLGAFLIGFVGWVTGMVTTWYSSPIAKLIGGGGDVANELAFVFTLVSFIPLRYFELKYVGR